MTQPEFSLPEEHERSVQVIVPASEGTSVTFPGHVTNNERAIEFLGGADSISNALRQQSAPLKCRPRKADGFSHPIYSSAAHTNRVLLQVKKTIGADGKVSHQVSAVAAIPTTHEFSGLADFQVVSSTVKVMPEDAIPQSNPNSPLTAEPTRRSHPLLCLPPVFSRSDVTFPYAFKAYMRRNLRIDLQWLPKAHVAMVTWDDAVPPMPDSSDPALVKVKAEHPALLKVVKQLWMERPGWLLPDLQERLSRSLPREAMQKSAVDSILCCLAYRFVQGVFQPVLFRKGFDPRRDKHAWALQALHCSLPDSWRGSTAQQALDAAAGYAGSVWEPPPTCMEGCTSTLATSYSHLVTLRHIPPTKTSYFQVCDVWHHEALCAPLWAAAGPPPHTNPQWGPQATAAPEATEAASAVAAAPAALAQAPGPAPGEDGNKGGGQAAPGEQQHNSDQPGTGAQAMLATCCEPSGWFPRAAWDAATQRTSRAVCGLLPASFAAAQRAGAAAAAQPGGATPASASARAGRLRLGALPPPAATPLPPLTNPRTSAGSERTPLLGEREGGAKEAARAVVLAMQGAHNLIHLASSNGAAAVAAAGVGAGVRDADKRATGPDESAPWHEAFVQISNQMQDERGAQGGKGAGQQRAPEGLAALHLNLQAPQDEDMVDVDH